jgi:MFS family permease
MSRSQSALGRWVAIISLIVAAEAIFTLPFHVARFFRPTLLLALGLDNTQLGLVQSAYGVVAMLAYFPGGPLADLFSARKLLTASLVATAAGGFYFSRLPSFEGLWILFAFWGLTSILLFWAALIRATREWGDPTRQGQAYGLLDAGRGLLAAGMASIAVALFAVFFPEDPTALTQEDRRAAIRGLSDLVLREGAGRRWRCLTANPPFHGAHFRGVSHARGVAPGADRDLRLCGVQGHRLLLALCGGRVRDVGSGGRSH